MAEVFTNFVSDSGAGKINPRYSVNFVEAVREGEAYSLNEELVEFTAATGMRYRGRDVDACKEIVRYDNRVPDTCNRRNQDASTAKGEYYLSEDEEALIAKITDTFAKTIGF